MACKGFWECLLKLLNFFLMLVGLAMVGYGIYLFAEYKNAASSGGDAPLPPPSQDLVQLGRPMLLAVSLADSIFDKLPKAWVKLHGFMLQSSTEYDDLLTVNHRPSPQCFH
ncbi:hypothetical protein SASPL_132949 [Salvia splendens]|uniref:Tobamovirus multiplication protein 2A n=1 Tax=Salvia splendens TaxID=180675 RepID=A0A8X8X0D8_SALSN|nr:hypothetical protein SASPL_132949 [Salvia splendens]